MLCLAEQIRRYIAGIGSLVCKHRDLTRSCNGIDPRESVHRFLCQRDEDVSGTYNLVYLGNGFGSVCQGCDRLGTAHLEDHINARLFRSHQGIGAYLPPAAGRRHDNLLHPRDLRRHYVHQNRGGIDRLPAGNIDADPLQRRDLLP